MPDRCRACTREVPDAVAACPHCGAALAAPPAAPPPPAAPLSPPSGAAAPPAAPSGSFFRPPGSAAAAPAAPSAPPAPPLLEDLPPTRRSLTGRDALLFLGGVVVLALAWYVSPAVLARRPPAPPAAPAATAPAPAAVPTAAPPAPPQARRLSQEDRDAAQEMLKALRTLQQSVASTPPKYAEYETQVLDAGRLLEPYFIARGGDADVKRNAQEALALHRLALSTWGLASRKEWAAILADPRIDLCASARAAREAPLAGGNVPRDQLEVMAGNAVANSVPQMWACAGSRVGIIEEILRES